MKPILTKYLYPLPEKLSFLPCYGLAFDNPRTPENIAEIEQLLIKAFPDERSLLSIFKKFNVLEELGNAREAFSIESTLLAIFDRFKKDDAYVRQFILDNLDENPLTAIARMWVQVTIDEQQLTSDDRNGERSFEYDVYKSDEKPEEIIENKLREFASLASLLTYRDRYWQYDSFLCGRSRDREEFVLGSIVFGYRLSCLSNNKGLKPMPWFHEDIEDLMEVFAHFDKSLAGSDRELFQYLSNLIYVSTNHGLTEKARLLLLVSVVELMLTHNPDVSRFNVEDSIGKQFLLKMAMVLYHYDPAKSMKELREELRHIYNVRSRIAHGDYAGLRKAICKRLSKTDYDQYMEESHLFDLNAELYMYIKVLVLTFFRSPDFIKFLKEN
jgi:hypothetical protein